ncbi:hypothetical protein LOTGIDRAFT_159978 [Lottia gigantea]|uniref:Uncharacterized protein n=1 Tax=Lottia gigantea TaxID=225164 RepID=V4AP42_LOTGI|nr:hypothetical protein LOTGIDRAFT_159978 [Lottia gigantea]ESO96560.1 hypothetical protein LOTGIDRAFT_159978 [Lottia gigantea]
MSMEESNPKQRQRQPALSELKLQSMLKTPCENAANNIIYLWKCAQKENQVRILKFRRNFSLDRRCLKPPSVSRKPRKSSSGTRQRSRTNSRNNKLRCRSELEKIEEVLQEESNLNHSAKESESDSSQLIPRSKSDEKCDRLEIETSIFDSQKKEIFLKFIPVDKNYQLIRKKIGNDRIGSSWIEIQAWCTKYQSKHQKINQIRPTIRKSQTLLMTKDRKPKFTIYGDNLEFGNQKLCEETSVRDEEILDHPRFGFHSNQEYLSTIETSAESRGNRIQFSIAPEVLSSSIQQCHQKTEMILSCLRTYFKDFADIEVMWVDSLRKHLPNKSFKSCFPSSVAEVLKSQTAKARAVLYVTKDVSILLRHPDTCFLSTLAFTAGISRDQLVILPFDMKPRYFSVVKRR